MKVPGFWPKKLGAVLFVWKLTGLGSGTLEEVGPALCLSGQPG